MKYLFSFFVILLIASYSVVFADELEAEKPIVSDETIIQPEEPIVANENNIEPAEPIISNENNTEPAEPIVANENNIEPESDSKTENKEASKAVIESLNFADVNNDSLKFRLLNHQREKLAVAKDKINSEISTLKIELSNIDQGYDNNNFIEADKEQKNIEQKQYNIEKEIYELEQKKILAEDNDIEIGGIQKKIIQQKKLLAIHEDRLESIQMKLNQATMSVQSQGRDREVKKDEISAKKAELARVTTELFNVETEIRKLLNRDSLQNDFRVQISIAFTILVGIVILGFYWLALRKEEIAKNIFTGEKGIQFITLFLIVIAIILFGIMGTLEGRELSALLGALAGYILGKTTSTVVGKEK